MNHIVSRFVLAGTAALGLSVALAQAPDPARPDSNPRAAGSSSAVMLTGCLAKGDQADEFSLQDSSGKAYLVKSQKVNLKPHVGHQVSLTGSVARNEGGGGGNDQAAKSAAASAYLQVSDLKMISTSCQQ